MSELATLITRLVDLYRFDPADAEGVIATGENEKCERLKENLSDERLLRVGDYAASKKLHSLLLEDNAALNKAAALLRSIGEFEPVDFSRQEFLQHLANDLVDTSTAAQESPEEGAFADHIIVRGAAELGISKVDFMIMWAESICLMGEGRWEEFNNDVKLDRFRKFLDAETARNRRANFQRPDLEVALIIHFLTTLDRRVDSLEKLEELDLSGIPPNLTGPFNEACHCYLAGYKTACVAICGAILEDLLKRNLRSYVQTNRGWSREALLIEAERISLLDPAECSLARPIFRLRDDAAHQLDKFQRASADKWIDCLGNTRLLIRRLCASQEARS